MRATASPVRLDVRAEADRRELALLEEPPPTSTVLQSFFFQPPPADNSVAPPAERLAAEIDLDQSGLTLAGRAGRRTVLGMFGRAASHAVAGAIVDHVRVRRRSRFSDG